MSATSAASATTRDRRDRRDVYGSKRPRSNKRTPRQSSSSRDLGNSLADLDLEEISDGDSIPSRNDRQRRSLSRSSPSSGSTPEGKRLMSRDNRNRDKRNHGGDSGGDGGDGGSAVPYIFNPSSIISSPVLTSSPMTALSSLPSPLQSSLPSPLASPLPSASRSPSLASRSPSLPSPLSTGSLPPTPRRSPAASTSTRQHGSSAASGAASGAGTVNTPRATLTLSSIAAATPTARAAAMSSSNTNSHRSSSRGPLPDSPMSSAGSIGLSPMIGTGATTGAAATSGGALLSSSWRHQPAADRSSSRESMQSTESERSRTLHAMAHAEAEADKKRQSEAFNRSRSATGGEHKGEYKGEHKGEATPRPAAAKRLADCIVRDTIHLELWPDSLNPITAPDHFVAIMTPSQRRVYDLVVRDHADGTNINFLIEGAPQSGKSTLAHQIALFYDSQSENMPAGGVVVIRPKIQEATAFPNLSVTLEELLHRSTTLEQSIRGGSVITLIREILDSHDPDKRDHIAAIRNIKRIVWDDLHYVSGDVWAFADALFSELHKTTSSPFGGVKVIGLWDGSLCTNPKPFWTMPNWNRVINYDTTVLPVQRLEDVNIPYYSCLNGSFQHSASAASAAAVVAADAPDSTIGLQRLIKKRTLVADPNVEWLIRTAKGMIDRLNLFRILDGWSRPNGAKSIEAALNALFWSDVGTTATSAFSGRVATLIHGNERKRHLDKHLQKPLHHDQAVRIPSADTIPVFPKFNDVRAAANIYWVESSDHVARAILSMPDAIRPFSGGNGGNSGNGVTYPAVHICMSAQCADIISMRLHYLLAISVAPEYERRPKVGVHPTGNKKEGRVLLSHLEMSHPTARDFALTKGTPIMFTRTVYVERSHEHDLEPIDELTPIEHRLLARPYKYGDFGVFQMYDTRKRVALVDLVTWNKETAKWESKSIQVYSFQHTVARYQDRLSADNTIAHTRVDVLMLPFIRAYALTAAEASHLRAPIIIISAERPLTPPMASGDVPRGMHGGSATGATGATGAMGVMAAAGSTTHAASAAATATASVSREPSQAFFPPGMVHHICASAHPASLIFFAGKRENVIASAVISTAGTATFQRYETESEDEQRADLAAPGLMVSERSAVLPRSRLASDSSDGGSGVMDTSQDV